MRRSGAPARPPIPGRIVAATLPDGTFALFGSTVTGGSLRGSNGGWTVYEVIP